MLLPFQNFAATNQPLAVLPFHSSRTHVTISATINHSKPLTFMLDTGFGISTIHPDLVKSLGLTQSGHLTIIGIAGDEQAPTYTGVVFDFNGQTYAPRRVASLPSDAEKTWRRRDGILGAGFFRHFVVEIDAAEKIVRLYDPEKFTYTGPGEIVPIQFTADTPIIDATVLSSKKVLIPGRFEVDTGCDDELCLAHDFVQSNKLSSDTDGASAGVKNGIGGGAAVSHGKFEQLQIGRLKLDHPSANFFAEGSPAAEGMAGHIGMAALRHWKIIFDYSRHRMILEKNVE